LNELLLQALETELMANSAAPQPPCLFHYIAGIKVAAGVSKAAREST